MMEAALTLAASGLAVFPCGADKAPLTAHGFKDATTDPDVIRMWASAWTMVGAAIPEGQVVIDVDPRNGGDDTLALFPKLPRTRTVKTRSGGRHFWLAIPEVNLRGKLGPGIDVKRPGKGYVIVPPSPGYTFVRGGAPADMPQWLLDELVLDSGNRTEGSGASPKFFPWEKGTAYGLAALRNAVAEIQSAEDGSRNDALNKAAFGMAQLEAGGEVAHAATISALIEAAESVGLGKWEIRNTIESGWSAGEQVPRQAPDRVAS